jgi:hypothetical protein
MNSQPAQSVVDQAPLTSASLPLMATAEQFPAHPLKNGQTWKMEYCYLRIVTLGKRLVRYEILKHLNQHALTSSLIGVVELLVYLQHCEAELIP